MIRNLRRPLREWLLVLLFATSEVQTAGHIHPGSSAAHLTLFTRVYKALSCAPYFRHCLIQLWMVQSLRYQQLGLCRNLIKHKRQYWCYLLLFKPKHLPSAGPSHEIALGTVNVLRSHES